MARKAAAPLGFSQSHNRLKGKRLSILAKAA